jgi:hypothetical protein
VTLCLCCARLRPSLKFSYSCSSQQSYYVWVSSLTVAVELRLGVVPTFVQFDYRPHRLSSIVEHWYVRWHWKRKLFVCLRWCRQDIACGLLQAEATFGVYEVMDIVNGDRLRLDTSAMTEDVVQDAFKWDKQNALARQALLACLPPSELTNVYQMKLAS